MSTSGMTRLMLFIQPEYKVMDNVIPAHKSLFLALATSFILAATMLSATTRAQDLEPRKYVNLPVGQNFLRVAGGYSWGEVELTPGLPLTDADLTLTGTSLAYLRTMDIAGKASSIDVYMGYFCASGSALRDGVRQGNDTCGNGDLKLRFSWNFIGAPAMPLDEFVHAAKEMVVGASVQVVAPVGQYDADRLLNIGANRWVLRPEMGVSLPIGKWGIEFSAGARFYQDNDEYLGDSTLAQDPVYNFQTHVVYDLSPRQWLSANLNYFFGGKTFVNDSPAQVKQENSRLGFTWNMALNSANVFQFSVNRGVITRVGNDSTTLSLAWLYRWE
jgi:hypothetical protein